MSALSCTEIASFVQTVAEQLGQRGRGRGGNTRSTAASRALALELLAVAAGARRACLNDHAALSLHQAESLLRAVAAIHPMLATLRAVLVAGVDFLFFMRSPPPQAPAATPPAVVIDAAGGLAAPRLQDTSDAMRNDDLAWSVDTAASISSWLLNDQPSRPLSMSIADLDMDSARQHRIVTLTGLLLGYPVVYTIDHDRRNCLSHTLLRLIRVQATLAPDVCQALGCTSPTTLLSFSLPDSLTACCQRAISAFDANLALTDGCQSIFSGIHTTQSVVVQDHIV
ncbi:hypothetical protein BC831DRAFT_457708, partial [Entophlyctis helioformis]